MDFCHGSRVEKVSLLIKSVIMNDSANIYYVFFLQICRLPLLVIYLLFWKHTDGFKGAVFSSFIFQRCLFSGTCVQRCFV